MDVEARFHRIAREAQEILVPDELKTLLGREEHPRAYIGFEPSGQLTLGSLITARKMRDLTDAGCDLTVLLADWHAWINDKMGGSLERIQAVGTYMEEAFHALGVDPGRTRFRWAHDVVERSAYWARVVRIAKAMSLQRAKRAMTIMGRGEDETQLDTAKLLYPAMQAADIFELPVDIAYSGMDQRRVHVLARELAQHFGWPVPVAIHTPLLPSLKGRGRMDPADPTGEGKMSKSDPTGAVLVPMEPEPVRSAIQAALCPAKQTDGNPVVDTVRVHSVSLGGSTHRRTYRPARRACRIYDLRRIPERLDLRRPPPRGPEACRGRRHQSDHGERSGGILRGSSRNDPRRFRSHHDEATIVGRLFCGGTPPLQS